MSMTPTSHLRQRLCGLRLGNADFNTREGRDAFEECVLRRKRVDVFMLVSVMP